MTATSASSAPSAISIALSLRGILTPYSQRILYSCGYAASHSLQVCIDEWINIACQVTFCIACLVVRAMILNNIIRMHRHRTDLCPEVGLDMLSLEFSGFLLAFLLLAFVEASLEQLHCHLAVLNLRAFVLTGNHNACGEVAYAHR